MKPLPVPIGLKPKEKIFLIGKEVRAVSIMDALRKERNAPVIEVREVYSPDNDE